MSLKEESREKYLGKKYVTKQGYYITIIEYINYRNVVIKFENGFCKTSSMKEVLGGSNINPYHPTIQGLGYIGVGKYKSSGSKSIKKRYDTWTGIFRRSYDAVWQERNRSYIGCSVDPRWYCFQDFGEWYDIYYKDTFELDKDIKFKGNKVYSPETCIFVPKELNTFFASLTIKRDLPPCIYKTKSGNFTSNVKINGEPRGLGTSNDIENLKFQVLTLKQEELKRLVNKWKNCLDKDVYKIILNYKISN